MLKSKERFSILIFCERVLEIDRERERENERKNERKMIFLSKTRKYLNS